MKILTVGACPYLLTHLGRMNSVIIEHFLECGHEVESAVWHLDTSWFLPDDDGVYRFEKNDKKLCKMYPFAPPFTGPSTPQLYEIVKKSKPDLIISIGDYTDIAPLYAMKTLDNKMFKWVSVLAVDGFPINEDFYEAVKTADIIITTTERAKNELEEAGIKCSHVPFGPNHKDFYPLGVKEDSILRVISLAKNSSSANVGAFIEAAGIAKRAKGDKIEFYLHTNCSSPGDYDIEKLIKRTGVEIKLPQEFVSINEGITNEELNKRYNSSDVIVDVSVRSSTALCVLEGMSTGCVPITAQVGAIGELNYSYCPMSVPYVGDNGENYEVIDYKSLSSILVELCEIKEKRKEEFANLSSNSIEVSSSFCEQKFVKKIEELTKEIDLNNRIISVEVI